MSGYPYTLREKLHKALDEAGIEYWMKHGGVTFFECRDGCECAAFAYGYASGNREPVLAVQVVGIKDPKRVIAMVNAIREEDQ